MSLRATEGSEARPGKPTERAGAISIFAEENQDCFVASLPRPRNGEAGAGLAMTYLNIFRTLSFIYSTCTAHGIPKTICCNPPRVEVYGKVMFLP